MLRLLEIGNGLPFSWIVDPVGEFHPGMVGQLRAEGNQTVCGVSDGRAPIGIIDEVRTKSFYSISVDEIVIAPATGVMSGGQLVTPIDINVALKNPNITPSSFISNPVSVGLTARNGMITFVAGTPLNASIAGNGTPDAIRTVVSYNYQVPNNPGDDSVMGSGRITIWFQRFIGATDQFDVAARYPLGGNLFCGQDGKMTTKQYMPGLPVVATVTGVPSSIDGFLEFLWL